LEELIKIRKNYNFDLVFIPSLHDIHQDHTTIAQEGLRAFKNTTLLGYELIWNNLTFNTQGFVKLERRHIEAKIEALKEYKSQGTRDYLSDEFILSLARVRGVQVGCEFAEAFEVIRFFL
jgi:LmbE family N-acetylglucosaminyl deacetylase